MSGDPRTTVSHDDCPRRRRALQRAIIAFFALAVITFIVIYLVAPAIYVETLLLNPSPSDARPLVVNLFFVAIILFVATLAYGVWRRWRWLFWLLLLAFLASALEIPGGILQLVGIIPIEQPTWYVLLRMAISVVEFALGLWMLRVWRACGVWAQGRAA
ncbi:MAG TPA: hypothetical protein VGF38_09430 [Ktedonobacterales bacterium]